jgi:hypothetical protein
MDCQSTFKPISLTELGISWLGLPGARLGKKPSGCSEFDVACFPPVVDASASGGMLSIWFENEN